MENLLLRVGPILIWILAFLSCIIGVQIGISKTTTLLQGTSTTALPSIETTQTADSNLTTTITTPTTTMTTINASNFTGAAGSSTPAPNNSTEETTLNTNTTSTTLAPAVTTSAPNATLSPDELEAQNKKKKKRRRQQDIEPTYYCPCDLKVNSCDANCCCDIDCLELNVLQTFNCRLKNYWSIYDYEQVMGLQSCSASSGLSLLCVVDRKQRNHERQDIKFFDLNKMKNIKYRWPQKFVGLPTKDGKDYYVSGDELIVWNEHGEMNQQLKIPYSLNNGNCHVDIPVNYLINMKSRCPRTFEGLQKFQQNFVETMKKVKISKTPVAIGTDAVIMADHCKIPENANGTHNCFDMDIFHCNGSLTKANCTATKNATFLAPPASLISIQFKHNFTHLLNCSVFFVSIIGDFNETNRNSVLIQTIQVRFIDANETFFRSKTARISGNLGYVLHKPLLATKYVIANESVSPTNDNPEETKVLGYYHDNSTRHYNDEYYIKIPSVDDLNGCIITNETFETINFGENSMTKCFVSLNVDRWSSGSNQSPNSTGPISERNFTAICLAFQKHIFNYLLHELEQSNTNSTSYDNFNVQISQLGNPKNESRLWIHLETDGNYDTTEIIGTYDKASGENHFTCQNVILNVRYEFYYAVAMLGGRANQALVKKVSLTIGPRLDLKFKLDENLKVPVYIDIMFHDLTGIYTGNSAVTFVVPSMVGVLFIAGILQTVL